MAMMMLEGARREAGMPALEEMPSSLGARELGLAAAPPSKSILVVSDRVGPTQHISFLQPLHELAKRNRISLRLERINRHWKRSHVDALFEASKPDLLVLSRCTVGPSSLVIDKARALRIPVVFHLDDDLLDVPASLDLPQHESYRDPVRLAALRDALEASDLIYVSTPALEERLIEHGIRGPMVHGKIYCSVNPDSLPSSYPATFPVIGYMGSAGHAADLALIAPVIERLLDATPALSFETFGTISPLPQLSRFGPRVMHHGPVASYSEFLKKLADLGWWVGLAPLADNTFNRCKADTKWVEYSYAGIAVVAQDIPVYSRACSGGAGLLAGGEAEWRGALRNLIRNSSARDLLVRNARAKLTSAYTHGALERQVLSVFAEARTIHAATLAARATPSLT